MNHCDVSGLLLALGIVDNGVPLGPRNAAGRKDLVVLVHAEGLPTQVLHWEGLTEDISRYGRENIAVRGPAFLAQDRHRTATAQPLSPPAKPNRVC